jgi:hypothetical protein
MTEHQSSEEGAEGLSERESFCICNGGVGPVICPGDTHTWQCSELWRRVSARLAAVQAENARILRTMRAQDAANDALMAENARLRARLAEVEALADSYDAWDGDPTSEFSSSPRQRAQLRAALASPSSLAQRDAEVGARVLREAADRHIAELVCCDVFERLCDKPSSYWTDAERREMRSHSICYWGAACAEGDRARADALAAEAGGES